MGTIPRHESSPAARNTRPIRGQPPNKKPNTLAKKKEKTNTLFVMLFILSFILGYTPMLAIVHEVGHVIFGGSGSHISGWTESYVRLTSLSCLGGHLFEFAVYVGLSFLFCTLRINPSVVGFFWGHAHAKAFVALRSYDFIMLRYEFDWSWGTIKALWIGISMPVLIWGWFLVIKRLRTYPYNVGTEKKLGHS